jgi:hypothetical protein
VAPDGVSGDAQSPGDLAEMDLVACIQHCYLRPEPISYRGLSDQFDDQGKLLNLAMFALDDLGQTARPTFSSQLVSLSGLCSRECQRRIMPSNATWITPIPRSMS